MPARRTYAVLLAAGLSRRMGARNKLLIEIGGEPMVRRIARALLEARPAGIVAVTGHQCEQVEEALRDLPLRLVHNPDFAEGMSTSLRHGLQALPEDAEGALIALGDMPSLRGADYGRLIEAFEATGCTAIVRATDRGRPGNPVILPRSLFAEAAAIRGDQGARMLLRSSRIVDVEIGAAAGLDVDEWKDVDVISAP